MLLWNYFVHVLKYSSMHFAPGGLAEELSDALSALSLSLHFPLSFPHTHTPSTSLSCGWRSVKSHLSSWMRTGSTKFPFLHVEPLRHRMEWWSMARHVWSPPRTQMTVHLHGPAALTLSQLSGLMTALWPLTEHWLGLFSLCFSSIEIVL